MTSIGFIVQHVAAAAAALALVLSALPSGCAQPLVPAIITFGDSAVDVGNNDYLSTIFKANFPPYGQDFKNHQATGRFCNGKLATDITAETLGFKSVPLPYLSPQASGKNLLIGANFASAASGFNDETAILYKAIALSQQLEYYREYRSKLKSVAGSRKATSILSGALYIIGTGTGDILQNYYLNPLLKKLYNPEEYTSFLVNIFSNFVKDLYGLGARRIGVTSLPPLGCLPASITLFGQGKNSCVAILNTVAKNFNNKVMAEINSISEKFPNLKIAALDVYTPLLDLATNPSKSGFFEARRGCCRTGTLETTLFLCQPKLTGTCSNATGYVFWDNVHPSEAANQFIADSLVTAGIFLIS